jgi:hypothetical protein
MVRTESKIGAQLGAQQHPAERSGATLAADSADHMRFIVAWHRHHRAAP